MQRQTQTEAVQKDTKRFPEKQLKQKKLHRGLLILIFEFQIEGRQQLCSSF